MHIPYETHGSGPPLIFTPGWMMNRSVWERQRPLEDSFRLIFWDLPESGPDETPLLLTHCASALHDIVEDISEGPVTYVGWSMGMSVFWKYLEQYGEDPFQQVVNIEMVPKMDPKATMVDAVERAMHRDRRHASEKFLRRALHNIDESDLARFIDIACVLPLDSLLSVYRDMAESDFSVTAATYAGQQHLAFGRHGFYVDHKDQLQNFFSDQTIHWFEHSAHAPFWEEAEEFNKWLKRIVDF